MIAYLDAGTGGLLVQMVAGGVAGAYAFVKYKAGGLFRRNKIAPPEAEALAEGTDDHAADAHD